jgi:hypothetical protein
LKRRDALWKHLTVKPERHLSARLQRWLRETASRAVRSQPRAIGLGEDDRLTGRESEGWLFKTWDRR